MPSRAFVGCRVHLICESAVEDAVHLRDLLLQRHARQQVFDARLDRRRGVPIDGTAE